MSVVYIDTRPDWMKREDKYMKCFWECPLLLVCRWGQTAKSSVERKYQKFAGENDETNFTKM